jgi:CDP-glucose 4,6-dehydratase
LRSLQNKVSVPIRNPHAIRPWQHVLEPLSGYLVLAERLYSHGQVDAEAWNFGPHEEDARPVQWVVERVCKAWGDQACWHLQDGTQPHEAQFLKLDISKARQRLNWQPRWSIATALARTTDWHQAWIAKQDMQAVCLHQISQYGAPQ